MKILKHVAVVVFSLIALSISAQENSGQKKLTPIIQITAQTPFRTPYTFYNKNEVLTHFFRSGYGAGLKYQFNENWGSKIVLNYCQQFIWQRFYFDGFSDNSSFEYRHIVPEIALDIGGAKTLVKSNNSSLAWNFSVQPWMGLSNEISSKEHSVTDLDGIKHNTKLVAYKSSKVHLNYATGFTYIYNAKKVNLGMDLTINFRGNNINDYTLFMDDLFMYSKSYTTKAIMLGITGFITF
jgi:hypothetical protein